jgi:trehalose 6-phosphate synthase
MPRVIRFVAALLTGLGLLTWGAYGVVTSTTRKWSETDVALRTSLAVQSARRSLTMTWSSSGQLSAVLDDITHDERIMAAAACSADGALRAATEAYPSRYACRTILAAARESASAQPESWSMGGEVPGGAIQLNAVRLKASGVDGFVVLVHDLSYVARREATTRNQLLLAFLVLAAGASALTVVSARLAWRGWTSGLRRALSGDAAREFQPLLRDVRELVNKLARERGADARGGPWNPARLRSTLAQHLHGERLVVLANREPYIHQRDEDGGTNVVHPASGLVTALEPVMRACSGVWIAHGSGSADRENVDEHDRVAVPPGEESYAIRRIWLNEQQEQGYYYGYANEGLWPLCHVAHERPEFRDPEWEQYRAVNQKFADAVCDEVDSDDPIVLVQDYHFALAPAMIRARLPRATIITFWHIPWPNPERFGICPMRNELLQGLLGSSILGFHTQQHCNNFLDAIDAFVESRIDRESNAVVQRARRTLVRPYPISIEWPVRWLQQMPSAQACRSEVLGQLGLPPDILLGVGVDRLDYTKGIEERLLAVDQLLRRYPEFRGQLVFAQLAAPSRTRIGRYRSLNDRIEQLAFEINERWAQGSYRPIALLRSHHEPPAVFRFFRAADFCYVSSLHDGMNLVAKEFVAAREDERGVLVLSQFAGAAKELTEALVVNPYDLRQASDALAAALKMPLAEQRERMRSMRMLVAEFNVHRWAGRMLVDAAELRRRDRLTGRLSTAQVLVGAEAK